MLELDILDQMIQEAAKIPLEEDPYGHLTAKLTESQCSDSSVTIHKMPEQAIIIKVDDFWSLESMFTHEKGQCKRADFVIIANTG